MRPEEELEDLMCDVTCAVVTVIYFFLLLLPLWSIGLISQFLDHFTDGRTPCTGDQHIAKAST
jgi:hypothetical protein